MDHGVSDGQSWSDGRGPSPLASLLLRPVTPWVACGLTVLSGLPIGAILAADNPKPAGSCSGIGFGCSLYGWDLARFALLFAGLPYVILLLVMVALTGLLPGRWRIAQVVVALAGLALPWVVVLIGAAGASG